jgi:hypothetical protein
MAAIMGRTAAMLGGRERQQRAVHVDRHQAQYGRIYEWLKRSAGCGLELEPLRAILRQHILDNWPLGVGDQACLMTF